MNPADPHHGLIVDLITQARRVSRSWTSVATTDEQITGAERDVLDYLVFEGAATVPQIARSRGVSRQHIQKRADSLVERQLAEFVENPAHKSSRLLEATIRGEQVHARASHGEEGLLKEISEELDAREIESARAILTALSSAIEKVK